MLTEKEITKLYRRKIKMSEIEKTELEKIQSLLLGVWAIEDKHNDEYSEAEWG